MKKINDELLDKIAYALKNYDANIHTIKPPEMCKMFCDFWAEYFGIENVVLDYEDCPINTASSLMQNGRQILFVSKKIFNTLPASECMIMNFVAVAHEMAHIYDNLNRIVMKYDPNTQKLDAMILSYQLFKAATNLARLIGKPQIKTDIFHNIFSYYFNSDIEKFARKHEALARRLLEKKLCSKLYNFKAQNALISLSDKERKDRKEFAELYENVKRLFDYEKEKNLIREQTAKECINCAFDEHGNNLLKHTFQLGAKNYLKPKINRKYIYKLFGANMIFLQRIPELYNDELSKQLFKDTLLAKDYYATLALLALPGVSWTEPALRKTFQEMLKNGIPELLNYHFFEVDYVQNIFAEEKLKFEQSKKQKNIEK